MIDIHEISRKYRGSSIPRNLNYRLTAVKKGEKPKVIITISSELLEKAEISKGDKIQLIYDENMKQLTIRKAENKIGFSLYPTTTRNSKFQLRFVYREEMRLPANEFFIKHEDLKIYKESIMFRFQQKN
jgi:hypothetical protein